MPKRPEQERSYFRFPISLLSLVDGVDKRPDSSEDSDGRRLGHCIIAHTLIEKGKAQLIRLGEEFEEEMGSGEYTAGEYGRSFASQAAEWLEYHRPGTLPAGLDHEWQTISAEDAAICISLAPGPDFTNASSRRPLPDSISEGGRLGGLGINAGPLPSALNLRSAYWDASHHVTECALVEGGRAMDANVRADFVRDLTAGRMSLRDFRVLAAVTAKLGGTGGDPFVQVTESHLSLLASGYTSQAALEATVAAFEEGERREKEFIESSEFMSWPEQERLDALATSLAYSTPPPSVLMTNSQIGYTLAKLCAPRGIFVDYLYNRRRHYVAHPKRLAKYAREAGEDPALTLARLVEEKHGRGDERRHARKAAAQIAKAERAALEMARDRDLAERLHRIEAGHEVSPSSAGVREQSGQSLQGVSPYIETPSEKQHAQNRSQRSGPHTAAGGAAAGAGRGSIRDLSDDDVSHSQGDRARSKRPAGRRKRR